MSSSATSVCPVCGGSGWKPVAGPERRLTRCECVTQQRADKLLEQARIPKRYAECEFANFHPELQSPSRSAEKAKIDAERFVAEYPLDNHMGLLIYGDMGVGKTHLAVSILKELIRQKGAQGLFYDYRELLKEIQNSYDPSVSATELGILRPVFEAEVLVLDELGATQPTGWVWDTVGLILNSRYNEKRTTVITTNFEDGPSADAEGQGGAGSTSLAAAKRTRRKDTIGDRIGDRMRSRLLEMCRLVEVRGKDIRPIKAKGLSSCDTDE